MIKKVVYIIIIVVILALGYYLFHRQLSNYSADNTLIATSSPTPTIIPRNYEQGDPTPSPIINNKKTNNMEQSKTVNLEGFTKAGEGSKWSFSLTADGKFTETSGGDVGNGKWVEDTQTETYGQKVIDGYFAALTQAVSKYKLDRGGDFSAQDFQQQMGNNKFTLTGFAPAPIVIDESSPAMGDIVRAVKILQDNTTNKDIQLFLDNTILYKYK